MEYDSAINGQVLMLMICLFCFLCPQFQIEPHSMEKPIKLQLPIMLATYPLRSDDGTVRRKRGAQYPSTLPIFRPWLDEKTFE